MEKNKLLFSAALTGLLLAGGCASQSGNQGSKTMMGQCHGMNACKGTGDCGGAGHACAGKNACKGKGWKKMSEYDCNNEGGEFKA